MTSVVFRFVIEAAKPLMDSSKKVGPACMEAMGVGQGRSLS